MFMANNKRDSGQAEKLARLSVGRHLGPTHDSLEASWIAVLSSMR
jgi:hypothetical protein